ncbi:formate-dependent phosphoribosylglycinamide formyltransferase [Leptospira levettii]|uniref:Formate-dependent phosphoribosylglycinamide formyltransferase n=1 Tax=Leptospira levettii TaxID=2023178 RepID=A0AAW5VA65_9LEPT|nr:formate-dependent phosphoribosylglycinamide formyltransferase [Leptospira levettii]MCW7466771.1 formate-dependent phosphoribosylglycinamide formyltransferase [Leptospira levettii]MCW7497569.1 formate-dependent phosphoribosylglycinamide formyltransferase [Leptospira levettii]MCW7512494.1 formate-dependent phosphoribosylglycinamide formyltransferase [Leptospira levettii]MCW7515928.1 formate-dependent phosphoribosylglycinamide formyltransferase [Leptospira levettii]TGM25786.1 formate-dependent
MIGTPFTKQATKLLLLGSGELGKEVAIEANRLGVHVIAVDRYPNAPAMLVAQESRVINMLDPKELEATIRELKPNYVVPEIEAIHTETLVRLESEGFKIIPSAKAVNLTMNREGIRNFVAKELRLKTSAYLFADTEEDFTKAIHTIGFPCVVKPIMSSSGKGQSLIKTESDIHKAWEYGQTGGRTGKGKMIIEEFIPFDFEITLLTIRHIGGTSFLPPIGHRQVNGDYVESWMPQPMSNLALESAKQIAEKVTTGLGGFGIFGVELFVKGDEVYFSEVSPRPHDTGLVTLISQNISEFSLHARALLGLPIPELIFQTPAASSAILLEGDTKSPEYVGLKEALSIPGVDIRIFGKPEVIGKRRMGVSLALGKSIEEAKEKANRARDYIQLKTS